MQPLFQDAQFAIYLSGEWLRVLPTGGPVLEHESARAGQPYQALDIPLPRLAGVSFSGRQGGAWWLRLTGCFHGLHDQGTQDGTYVDVGPISQQVATAAAAKIREAVPMPRLEPAPSLPEVLGASVRQWLTVVTRWEPNATGQPDLQGAYAAWPKSNVPPADQAGAALSVRGLLEGPELHGPGRHVLHVLSWRPLHGDVSTGGIVGTSSTLPPGMSAPVAVVEHASTMAQARPFDRFTEGMTIEEALALFPHAKADKIRRERWQANDAELSPGLRGNLQLMVSPGLTRMELTIPFGPEIMEAGTKAAFAIAQLSVYGTLVPYRKNGSTDPVTILRGLVESPPTDDQSAVAEPLVFVDQQNPKVRVPFQIKYWAAADNPALIYHARADWAFDLRRG